MHGNDVISGKFCFFQSLCLSVSSGVLRMHILNSTHEYFVTCATFHHHFHFSLMLSKTVQINVYQVPSFWKEDVEVWVIWMLYLFQLVIWIQMGNTYCLLHYQLSNMESSIVDGKCLIKKLFLVLHLLSFLLQWLAVLMCGCTSACSC